MHTSVHDLKTGSSIMMDGRPYQPTAFRKGLAVNHSSSSCGALVNLVLEERLKVEDRQSDSGS